MASFEAWDHMMDGILHYAGFTGFLSRTSERRKESDFHHREWADHLQWLCATFGDRWFTTHEVRQFAMQDSSGYEAPPGMEDTTDKGYTRQLGKQYAQKVERLFDGLSLDKGDTRGHGNVLKWRIRVSVEDHPGGDGGNGGNPQPTCSCENTLLCVDDVSLCVSRVLGRLGVTPVTPKPPALTAPSEEPEEPGCECGTFTPCSEGPLCVTRVARETSATPEDPFEVSPPGCTCPGKHDRNPFGGCPAALAALTR